MTLHPSQFEPRAPDLGDGAPVYPFATILNPGHHNHSRRPIQWLRWIGLAVALAGLLAACYSC